LNSKTISIIITSKEIIIMKKVLPLFLAALFVFAGTIFPESPKDITVTGTLIDTKCYGMMPDANIGNTHKLPGKDGKMMDVPNCATACSGMGIPSGIVEGGKAGNKTYVLIVSATALKDHMAKEARVSGTEAFGGGIIVAKVEIRENGKWVDVTPGAMM
jgi:hypothetical protein